MNNIKSFFVLLLVAPLFGAFLFSPARAQITSGGPVCGVDIVTIMNEPGQNATISGSTVPLIATSNPANGLSKIEFHTLQRGLIGSGGVGTNSSVWSMRFDTFSYANGPYDIFARSLYFNTATQQYQACDSAPVHVNIANGTSTDQESLIVDLNTKYWEGPTNIWVIFSAKAYVHTSSGTNVEVTANSAFEWKTTIGSLAPAHDKATFKSGAVTGEGTVSVKALFNDKVALGNIKINIFPNSTYSTYPSTTTADTSTDSTTTATDSAAITQNELDPKLAQCLKQSVGDDRYADFVATIAKPTYTEMKRAWACFEQTKFVIPTNWAPVKPEEVKNLPKDPKKAKIQAISNTKSKSSDGSQKDAILLRGTSLPNSDVFIYVFSEPLVLATQTDSDGNWSYTLENPLEPGQHEAYVTVNGGDDNYVASEPIVFSIARAESSDQNPQGASLLLSNSQNTWQNNYLLYGAILVGLALIFVLFYVKRRLAQKVTINNVA